MPSTPEGKKRVLIQVRRIREQVGALERSLGGDTGYHAIPQQIAAVRDAVNELMTEVLESHIRETLDRNGCYSREVSQSVGDTTELVHAYLKQLNLLLY